MQQLGVIVVCILLGYVLRRFRLLPAATPEVLNRWIVLVALPAICLQQVYTMPRADLRPAGMAWLIFVGSAVIALMAGIALRWDRARIGTVMFCSGVGNTALVGYPVVEALYGKGALQTAVITDQCGSVLVVTTIGMATVAYCGGRWVSWRQLLRRLVTFPPFVGLVVAFLLRPIALPPIVLDVASRLAATLSPFALVAVGWAVRLDPAPLARLKAPLLVGLGYKLLLAPLLVVYVYWHLLGQRGSWVGVTILQSAMPPSLATAIIIAEQGLEADLAFLLVGLGLPLSAIGILLSAHYFR